MEKVSMIYYKWASKLAHLLLLNALWLIGTILGLGIVGFFPSTVALFATIRKLKQYPDVAVIKTFISYFRDNFMTANRYGLPIIGLGYLLLVEYRMMSHYPSQRLVQWALLVLMFILIILLLYFFPIFVHFKVTKWSAYYQLSIVFALGAPLVTIVLVASLVALNYVIMQFAPALYLFMGASLFASITHYFVSLVINRQQQLQKIYHNG